MSHFHSFVTHELNSLMEDLLTRHYVQVQHQPSDHWLHFSKDLSGVITKHYYVPANHAISGPGEIRVSYSMVSEGRTLQKLTQRLKTLNSNYREALPIWKTKRHLSSTVREERWQNIQRFLKDHHELISCFRYEGDPEAAEGNASFNLEVGSTIRERMVCFEFVKSLLEAFTPLGIVRGQRQADKPKQQRDGWIKRYATMHRKRGWRAREILSEIQKELREGTWNERNRQQYNLAINTIGRIAGLKTERSFASLRN